MVKAKHSTSESKAKTEKKHLTGKKHKVIGHKVKHKVVQKQESKACKNAYKRKFNSESTVKASVSSRRPIHKPPKK